MAFVASVRFLETTARGARVFLYGEGPDNALRYEWRPYLHHLIQTRQPRRVMQALLDDVSMHPRLIFWSSIRQAATAGRQARRWDEQFPDWLAPSFSARLGCRDRWAEQHRDRAPMHPMRPLAYATLDPVRWQALFDDCDVSGARGQAEFRHPYLDLRLLRYLLALPAMPWCRNKLIIRRAMRGALPSAVLQRKKTTVATSADFQRVRAGGLPRLSSSPELTRFVNPSRMPVTAASERELRSALRPLGLGYWLEHRADGESEDQCYGIENTVAV
jgi:asparagine synthase (glutamine-hydrolysing)